MLNVYISVVFQVVTPLELWRIINSISLLSYREKDGRSFTMHELPIQTISVFYIDCTNHPSFLAQDTVQENR